MAPTSKMALGIKRASRSHSYHRRGLWAVKAKNGGAFPKSEKPAAVAEPKFYPARSATAPPFRALDAKLLHRPPLLRALHRADLLLRHGLSHPCWN